MLLVSADMVQGCSCAVHALRCDFSLPSPFAPGEGWCWPFAPVLEPAQVPSCWSEQDVVPAVCLLGLCCGDERLHRRMSEVWELLGLTCTERGGKKMEGFFLFPFFLFFLILLVN